MKEQAGFAPGPDVAAEGQGPESLEVEFGPALARLVVPRTQRLAMPVQRLDRPSLRRLASAPGRLAPARIAASSPVAAPSNDR